MRVRNRQNFVLLDQWTNCANRSEALAEACAAVHGLARKLGVLIDPQGRIDVEDQSGRPVARLLLAEELSGH